MSKKGPKPMHELHVRAMFEQACASQGLTGDKIEDAGEMFIQLALDLGVEIKFPKTTHLAVGVTAKVKP